MTDKQIELLRDITHKVGMSNCCSAKVYGDLCGNCMEHCDVVGEEEN